MLYLFPSFQWVSCQWNNYALRITVRLYLPLMVASFRTWKTAWRLVMAHVMAPYTTCNLILASQVSSCLESSQALKWHFRVGHPHLNKLKLMVPCLSNVSHIRCEPCELSKHRSASLPSSSKLSLIKHLISFILMYGVPWAFLINIISSIMYYLWMIIVSVS